MANPQCEEGFTKIANEIQEALCRTRISGEERQILDVIFRKTYGWNKCEDRIALSQFMEMTGMKKPNVARSIKGLLSKMIISVIKSDNSLSHLYKFTKDYHVWRPLPKKTALSKVITTVIKIDNKPLSKVITTKENKQKKITKEIEVEIIYPEWLPKETFKEFVLMRQEKKTPLPKISFNRFFKKLKKISDESGFTPEEILDQSISHGWQGIFELKDKSKSDKKEAWER